MAGAAGGAVRPLHQPREIADLALRQADQARTDFAAIEDALDFIMGQMLMRRHLAWVALTAFAGGAVLGVLATLLLCR